MAVGRVENYTELAYDTDRRYHRKVLPVAVQKYADLGARLSQRGMFDQLIEVDDEYRSFRNLWPWIRSEFAYFGRLSTYSYMEYLRIMGLPLDCDQLFLEDLSGSKSHRNGIAKVCGRDDLDWHESNPTFRGKYDPEVMGWLIQEGRMLYVEARVRALGKPWRRDVSYFTLESALCTFKSWFRPNRRYPNVYTDMLYGRIKVAEDAWPDEDLTIFWEAREKCLPKNLLLEANPRDVGLHSDKQNHFWKTGEVVMMDEDWECFRNGYNDAVAGV